MLYCLGNFVPLDVNMLTSVDFPTVASPARQSGAGDGCAILGMCGLGHCCWPSRCR